jgi:hypothetical protein
MAALGLLAGCGLPFPTPTSERMRLIGVLGDTPGGRWDSFWDGLRELGWVEGRNLAVESRWAGETPPPIAPSRPSSSSGRLR